MVLAIVTSMACNSTSGQGHFLLRQAGVGHRVMLIFMHDFISKVVAVLQYESHAGAALESLRWNTFASTRSSERVRWFGVF